MVEPKVALQWDDYPLLTLEETWGAGQALDSLISRVGGVQANSKRYRPHTLPAKLSGILASDIATERYRRAFEIHFDSLDQSSRMFAVAALYLQHIDQRRDVVELGNMFSIDPYNKFGNSNNIGVSFLPVRIRNGVIISPPATGVENILSSIVAEHPGGIDLILNTLKHMIDYLIELHGNDYREARRLNNLARYSGLGSLKLGRAAMDKFFDSISAHGYYQRDPNFWVQWHIAMMDSAHRAFVKAEQFLRRARLEGERWGKDRGQSYDFFQIEDREAKFKMITLREKVDVDPNYARTQFDRALEISERLLKREKLSFHVFETLNETANTYKVHFSLLQPGVQLRVLTRLSQLTKSGASLIFKLEDGYPLFRSEQLITMLRNFVAEYTNKLN